ncbi:MAG: branched chain amino acid aminotransferase, partial [Enterobacterales bacterium]|nr:branched chain amino acid aminotransferase [Enterobacterales bacterium]
CGPITKQIQEAFFGLFTGKTEDQWGWLDLVNAK